MLLLTRYLCLLTERRILNTAIYVIYVNVTSVTTYSE